jgi:uncharacterized protein
MKSLRRYCPRKLFPPYSYLSGLHPHPVTDPAGHSYGENLLAIELDPGRWAECDRYLWAIDLFNHGYYWEAHEAWESLWVGCGRHGTTADFLKSLIKLAAAGVKLREGKPHGVRRHADRAGELLRQVLSATAHRMHHFAGLNLDELLKYSQKLAETPMPVEVDRSLPVQVLLTLQLCPQ